MLEKKQKLYESMKKGKGNSLIADNFLVDFSGGNEEDDEDELGRSLVNFYFARLMLMLISLYQGQGPPLH